MSLWVVAVSDGLERQALILDMEEESPGPRLSSHPLRKAKQESFWKRGRKWSYFWHGNSRGRA